MAKPAIEVREVSESEYKELLRLSRSKTAQHRLVMRAQLIMMRLEGVKPGIVAKEVGITASMVSQWVKRFNSEGMGGLKDRPGRGRKEIYNQDHRSIMVMVALTPPQELGLGFNYWSLERMVSYINQTHDLGVSRAQLGRILEAEGLKWYQEKSYFTEGPDPDFAEKRGPL